MLREQVMKTTEEVFNLAIGDFFSYLKSIDYGYKDTEGRIHRISVEENYSDKEDGGVYSFSSPEEVIKNNCGWCWDVAELIKSYCIHNKIACKTYFAEYRSAEAHHAHTQVFVYYKNKWFEAPDNSSPVKFGENGCGDLGDCVSVLFSSFIACLRSTLKENYSEKNLLIKEIDCKIPQGISDEEYLDLVRKSGMPKSFS